MLKISILDFRMNPLNNTSADDKLIGFEYQYYVFFLALLDMNIDEGVGFEVKDDVHIENINGTCILIQAKHGLKAEKDNIPTRDTDLWKTFYNWILFLKLSDNIEQKLENTWFRFVTNKKIQNDIVSLINKVKSKKTNISSFRSEINKVKDETQVSESNKKLLKYMETFLELSDAHLEQFILKISFQSKVDDLINKIKKQLKHIARGADNSRIEKIYNSLNSNIRDQNYLQIKKKEKIYYDYDTFNIKFKSCFAEGSDTYLTIIKEEITLPEQLENQTFIKQMININALNPSDIEDIEDYTNLKIAFKNQIDFWLRESEITPLKRNQILGTFKRIWKNKFDEIYLEIREKIIDGYTIESLEKEIKSKANKCLLELKQKEYKIDQQDLDIELSNGQLYYLSDIPEIGWELNWEEKYK